MKLGEMRAARSAVDEDALDKYRRDVEKRVQDWIAVASDEDLEPFFEHIMMLFARGVSAARCARAWLRSTHKLGSVSGGAEAMSRADSAKCLEHPRDRTVRRTRPLASG